MALPILIRMISQLTQLTSQSKTKQRWANLSLESESRLEATPVSASLEPESEWGSYIFVSWSLSQILSPNIGLESSLSRDSPELPIFETIRT